MDGVAGLGRYALHTAGVEPLRRRIREFVAEHGREVDRLDLRRELDDGTSMADLVDEGRAERL